MTIAEALGINESRKDELLKMVVDMYKENRTVSEARERINACVHGDNERDFAIMMFGCVIAERRTLTAARLLMDAALSSWIKLIMLLASIALLINALVMLFQ